MQWHSFSSPKSESNCSIIESLWQAWILVSFKELQGFNQRVTRKICSSLRLISQVTVPCFCRGSCSLCLCILEVWCLVPFGEINEGVKQDVLSINMRRSRCSIFFSWGILGKEGDPAACRCPCATNCFGSSSSQNFGPKLFASHCRQHDLSLKSGCCCHYSCPPNSDDDDPHHHHHLHHRGECVPV